MALICEAKNCTGCGLCTAICPKACITLEKNEYGTFKYRIDEEKCIHCGKCERMCPQNSKDGGNVPIKCYAGWAKDPSERATSASGGIAAALYRWMIKSGGVVVGALYEDGEFRLKLAENEEDIGKFKGSKYVNCTSKHIFRAVGEAISQQKRVLFIGTPCQVAAIKAYIGESDLLYTVDLICHGTPPQACFEEHFEAHRKKIAAVNFREGGTIFRFRMDDADGNIYRVDGGTDEYYLSFINGVSFSDCCYECRYANQKRISDITIGDFWGIDEEIGKQSGVARVSLLLCNTLHGEKLLGGIDDIQLIERELAEALPQNEQLTRPFRKSQDRIKFEKLYPKYGFDKTIHKLDLEKTRRKNQFLTKLSNLKRRIIKK